MTKRLYNWYAIYPGYTSEAIQDYMVANNWSVAGNVDLIGLTDPETMEALALRAQIAVDAGIPFWLGIDGAMGSRINGVSVYTAAPSDYEAEFGEGITFWEPYVTGYLWEGMHDSLVEWISGRARSTGKQTCQYCSSDPANGSYFETPAWYDIFVTHENGIVWRASQVDSFSHKVYSPAGAYNAAYTGLWHQENTGIPYGVITMMSTVLNVDVSWWSVGLTSGAPRDFHIPYTEQERRCAMYLRWVKSMLGVLDNVETMTNYNPPGDSTIIEQMQFLDRLDLGMAPTEINIVGVY